MSRLGVFACLLMLVAVAVCVDMTPNTKSLDPPKDGAKMDTSRTPQTPPPRPEGTSPRTDGKTDLPKVENPKSETKPPQDGKS